MKKIFALAIALTFTAFCNAEETPKVPIDIDFKKTKSVKCYSGNITTYKHDSIILSVPSYDATNVKIKEVDTGVSVQVPISQCYFRDN